MVNCPNQADLGGRRVLLDRLLCDGGQDGRGVGDSRATSDEKNRIVLLRARIVSIGSFDADGDLRSLADPLIAGENMVRKCTSNAVLDPEDEAELVVVARCRARNVAYRERVGLSVQPRLLEEVRTPEREVAVLACAPGPGGEGDVEENCAVADRRVRLQERTTEDEARVEEAGEVANDARDALEDPQGRGGVDPVDADGTI